MATLRPDEPEDTPAPATPTPPAHLRVGRLAEVWSETGHPTDLGSAMTRWNVAADAWHKAQGIGQYEHSRRLPSAAPWSLVVPDWQRESGRPHGDPLEQLANLGFTEADVPALRQAAQQAWRDATDNRNTDNRRTS